jgi:thioredoxin-related protein
MGLSRTFAFRSILFVAGMVALSLNSRLCAQATSEPAERPATQPALPNIYDPAADAKAQIATAVEKAKRENQRVLIMFGGNWCPWCHRLHGLFKSDQDIAKTLLYEYQLVLVDIGRSDKNTDIVSGYGLDLKKDGVPYLLVLDGEGKVVARQETGALESGDHHDPDKVAAFLKKRQAKPVDAEKLLADSLSRAAKQEKLVFAHLGAPWCPWCIRLDDFLARKEIAEIIRTDFIDLKIDVDRMTNAKDIVQRLRKEPEGGIPWIVILDAKGKALTTSDGPKGNIGYPAEPEEISHFIGMLKKTTKRMTAEQIGQIEKALKDAAQKLKRPSP